MFAAKIFVIGIRSAVAERKALNLLYRMLNFVSERSFYLVRPNARKFFVKGDCIGRRIEMPRIFYFIRKSDVYGFELRISGVKFRVEVNFTEGCLAVALEFCKINLREVVGDFKTPLLIFAFDPASFAENLVAICAALFHFYCPAEQTFIGGFGLLPRQRIFDRLLAT